jgi:hypothetical protein
MASGVWPLLVFVWFLDGDARLDAGTVERMALRAKK